MTTHQLFTHTLIKLKFTLQHALKAYGGSRGIALLHHHLGARRYRVVNDMRQPLYPWERDLVPIIQDAQRALGPDWTHRKSRLHQELSPGLSNPWQVAIPAITQKLKSTTISMTHILPLNKLHASRARQLATQILLMAVSSLFL